MASLCRLVHSDGAFPIHEVKTRAMETHLEKRKCRRYQAHLAVRAQFADVPGIVHGETRNISSAGAFFHIPRTEAAQIGGKVSLEILVPEDFALAGGNQSTRMFRICATGSVVRLFHDGEMDLTRVAVAFSRHRLVRDEDAGNTSQVGSGMVPASSSPEFATPQVAAEVLAGDSLDAVLAPTARKRRKY